jgi:glucose/mannose-6-phosphate isomerase
MKALLCGLDRQITEALEIGRRFSLPKPKGIDKVLFCGMGGSAIGGDVLRLLVSHHSKIPFKVNRSGELPHWTDSGTLAILSSYSGNTAEILSVVEPLLKKGAKVIALCSGGKLPNLAKQKNFPCFFIPGGIMPRCAIGYMTFSLMPLLKRWGWLTYSERDVQEALRAVRRVPQAKAKTIAKKLHGRYVHFYGSSNAVAPALTRWRAQWAENAKSMASQHLMPEMFHNEIEGWRFPKEILKRSAAVFLKDEDDPEWLAPKIRAVQAMIRKAGALVMEIPSEGRTLLGRLFSLMALGDWVSYELALLNGVDPLGIPAIESIKKIK